MNSKDQKPLKLASMAPLDDGGRKYNTIYVIAVAVGLIVGIFNGNGISAIAVAILLALLVALVIKNCILDLKWKGLRQIEFLLEKRVPYDILIHHLIGRLSALNFQVEKGTDGNPILTHKKMIYDVAYGEDDTFTIYWRKSLVNAFFDFRTSIYHYRNTVADMGIIGYTVQEICCENTFGNGQQNASDNTQYDSASGMQGNPRISGENLNTSQINPGQGMNYSQMNGNSYAGYATLKEHDKKKHTGLFVAIAIFILMVFGGIYWLVGSSDEELVDEEAFGLEDNKEGKPRPDSREDDFNDNLSEDVQNNTLYGLNESVAFELNNGGRISVTFTKYGEKEDDTAYINYEIENIGNTVVTVGESMFSVYANDYIADLNYGANTVYEETISVGRKLSGTLYPNMLLDKVKRLEIECGDVIFLLRDTGTVDAMLGTYYRQYEKDGNIVIDEISLYREALNNNGLAISARHHVDYGIDNDYNYEFNSWTFELYDDRIEFDNLLQNIEGLVVYYSQNPIEEGISVRQVETVSIEDMYGFAKNFLPKSRKNCILSSPCRKKKGLIKRRYICTLPALFLAVS